jgi:uncharacterized protein YdiU (UPF0061 family)
MSLSAMALLPSCNWQTDYTPYIITVDSLIKEVQSVNSYLDSVSVSDISQMRDSTEMRLDYIQKNYVGEMRKDIGLAASNYKTTFKLIKNNLELVEKSKEEAPKTILQLTNLKKTMDEKATEDAVGNKIDEAYVKKAIGRETEEAGKLIKAKEILSKDLVKAKERYTLQSPKIQYWVDSIPELKAPKQTK